MAATRITGYRHLQERRKSYLVLGSIDDDFWLWEEDHVREFDRLWKNGLPFWEIVQQLKEHPDKVLLLAIDRILKGAIGPRPGGVFGKEWKR